jgi:hypothetical protein
MWHVHDGGNAFSLAHASWFPSCESESSCVIDMPTILIDLGHLISIHTYSAGLVTWHGSFYLI